MRLKSTLALLAFLLACAPTLARADYAAGLQAYDSGDYTTAYLEWLPLAKQGDAKAQHGLALLYETGHGVPTRDDTEAA
jgi:TPR repeat protein